MERNMVYDAMLSEIDRLGGKVDGVRNGKGGHRVVYWTTAAGAKAVSTVQAYTGNWRSVRHARSNVRRAAVMA